MPRPLHPPRHRTDDTGGWRLPPVADDGWKNRHDAQDLCPSVRTLLAVYHRYGVVDWEKVGDAAEAAASHRLSFPSIAPVERSGSGACGAAVSTGYAQLPQQTVGVAEGTPHRRLADIQEANRLLPAAGTVRRRSASRPFTGLSSEWFCYAAQRATVRKPIDTQEGAAGATSAHPMTAAQGAHCNMEERGGAAPGATQLPNIGDDGVAAADQLGVADVRRPPDSAHYVEETQIAPFSLLLPQCCAESSVHRPLLPRGASVVCFTASTEFVSGAHSSRAS
ncbi:hypothetical protein STCU_10767 [Strigomonas culicis]|uniref:Uncharacterized protein n=1 Tax=Strigomonas culicis TaxID=28005 RepID=S9V309_9TRYP|nr:hypothetical protein STCU_10767 [Strigomonas culicis]|eukprot:EPY17190.1 hypothetical protein STCU_10767 [Strigomonas culicis]